MFKTCSRCGEVKSIKDFIKDIRYKGGLTSVCRACRNTYKREQYLVQKEIFLKRAKVWRDKNKKKRNIYAKDYRNKNKDQLKLLAKNHYERHRTKIIEKSKKYYQDHKEACQARKKLWRIKNKESIREYNKKYKLEHKSASL